MAPTQSEKAEVFRSQHTDDKLLLLPNVWDALSAKLVAALGFPSVATASAAVALANGYQDGENIPFTRLLEIVAEITAAVNLPVTVDMERGYARDLPQLKQNIRALVNAGAVGLNFEDGLGKDKGLTTVDEQCRKIEAIREAGIASGVPLVINARTDIFLQPGYEDRVGNAISRGKAYQKAGADCFFPVLIDNYEDLSLLLENLDMPVNVLLLKAVSDLRRLENMGVARVSVGPALFKLALTKIKNAAGGLLDYRTEALFAEEPLSNDFIEQLIRTNDRA